MNILLFNVRRGMSVSFYRCELPFVKLKKEGIKYDFYEGEDINWHTALYYDIFYFQTPHLQEHADMIVTLKNFNKKVWVDYDDNLFVLPTENKMYNEYNEKRIAQITKEILCLADVVTVSTDELKDTYKKYNRNIQKISNGTDLSLFGELKAGVNNFIAWRGSYIHIRNLYEFKDAIIKFSHENPDWIFQFFGCHPWYFYNKDNEKLFNFNWFKHIDIIESIYRMKKFSSKLMIVPMVDNSFMRSRSHIAWIEGTIAGSVVIAPKFQEWNKDGIIPYHNYELYYFDDAVSLNQAMNNMVRSELLYDYWKESVDSIKRNYTLNKLNQQRISLIKDLQE